MVEILNAFVYCRQVLLDRLKEAPPGRIQLLTGPRQVGKTTLLLEIAERFGDRAVYVAGDDPDGLRIIPAGQYVGGTGLWIAETQPKPQPMI